MNHQHPKVNIALSEAYRAEAMALDAQAAAKRAQAAALEEKTDGNTDLLFVEQTLEQYQVGRDALLNASDRGELHLVRGARNRIMVERAELERYIKSRPVRPRKAAPASDLDDWEKQADLSLKALQGGRK